MNPHHHIWCTAASVALCQCSERVGELSDSNKLYENPNSAKVIKTLCGTSSQQLRPPLVWNFVNLISSSLWKSEQSVDGSVRKTPCGFITASCFVSCQFSLLSPSCLYFLPFSLWPFLCGFCLQIILHTPSLPCHFLCHSARRGTCTNHTDD